MTIVQAITQLPLEPLLLSSLTGGRSAESTLHTTQLPLEPLLLSSSMGGRIISSGLVVETDTVWVKASIDREDEVGSTLSGIRRL